ncbi:hypothetical protein L198_05581 [Cryptococcus wingfieldii CBS 7118]|uniref:Zn(2)-C6 fungal-type domain-containing protein n=1 Tax=Cryptococcus wingfieldii CBS 7118 TaxID=1295528 RepID=A0A1E3IY04_9TREE|nr:hypothetical protein L198_05581 [Cryptococcus wingfieldii CBS 7118]ODN92786.1 hypothetical protein L198_05581 [Cryptococcus wingfieldii CBS 7118]
MDRRPHRSPLPGAPPPGTSSRQQTFEGLPTLEQGFYPIQRHQVHPGDAPPWTSQQPVHILRSESELNPQQDIYSTGVYQELPYASSEIPQQPSSSSRNDRDRMQGGQGEQQQQRVGRKRGRVPTSCTECRARKQRCDGAQPCLQCSKRQVDPSICRYEIDPRTTSSREAGQEGTGPSGNEGRKEKRRRSEAPMRDDVKALAHGMWNAPLAFSGGRFDDERRRAGDDGLARHQMTERNPRPPNLDTMLNDLSAYPMVGSGIRRRWDESRSGMQQGGSLNMDLYGVQSAHSGSNSHHNRPPIIPPSPVLRPRSEADVRGDSVYEGYGRTKRNSAPKSSSSEGDASPMARRVRDLSPPGPQKEDSTARNAFKRNGFFISDAAKMILGPTTAAKEARPQSDFDKAQSWSPENIKSRCLGKLPAKERCDELVQRYFDRFNRQVFLFCCSLKNRV